MINDLSNYIKQQSVIKNNAEREIIKLKQIMINNSPYKIGDEVDTNYSMSGKYEDQCKVGGSWHHTLQIKSILVVTIDGGNTWKLGYTLHYSKNDPTNTYKHDFEVDVPNVKGRKRKWKNKKIVFFEEDFVKLKPLRG